MLTAYRNWVTVPATRLVENRVLMAYANMTSAADHSQKKATMMPRLEWEKG
jgi:hypothetical protein